MKIIISVFLLICLSLVVVAKEDTRITVQAPKPIATIDTETGDIQYKGDSTPEDLIKTLLGEINRMNTEYKKLEAECKRLLEPKTKKKEKPSPTPSPRSNIPEVKDVPLKSN